MGWTSERYDEHGVTMSMETACGYECNMYIIDLFLGGFGDLRSASDVVLGLCASGVCLVCPPFSPTAWVLVLGGESLDLP